MWIPSGEGKREGMLRGRNRDGGEGECWRIVGREVRGGRNVGEERGWGRGGMLGNSGEGGEGRKEC